jgi:hypothetical protein
VPLKFSAFGWHATIFLGWGTLAIVAIIVIVGFALVRVLLSRSRFD